MVLTSSFLRLKMQEYDALKIVIEMLKSEVREHGSDTKVHSE